MATGVEAAAAALSWRGLPLELLRPAAPEGDRVLPGVPPAGAELKLLFIPPYCCCGCWKERDSWPGLLLSMLYVVGLPPQADAGRERGERVTLSVLVNKLIALDTVVRRKLLLPAALPGEETPPTVAPPAAGMVSSPPLGLRRMLDRIGSGDGSDDEVGGVTLSEKKG